MSSSFTEFREKGFWCRDGLLEVWLRVLCLHFDPETKNDSTWQKELRDQWLDASTGHCAGWVSAMLDEYLTDDERVSTIVQLAERTLESLHTFGPWLPMAFLNNLGIGNGRFLSGHPMRYYDMVAEHFISLLRGELQTVASTSPTLPGTELTRRQKELIGTAEPELEQLPDAEYEEAIVHEAEAKVQMLSEVRESQHKELLETERQLDKERKQLEWLQTTRSTLGAGNLDELAK